DLGDLGKRVFECDTRGNRCRGGAKKGAVETATNEQFGFFQSPPQAPVRLSCAEIRQLFWQVVLAAERSVAALLRWSGWRRWHQAWARYYHYRARAGSGAGQLVEQTEQTEAEQPTNVIEMVWHRLEPLLPSQRRVGRPYDYSRRLVFDAIVHVMQT